MPLWIKHQSTVTPQAATNSATGAPVRYFQFYKNKRRNGEPLNAAKTKCGAARKRGAKL